LSYDRTKKAPLLPLRLSIFFSGYRRRTFLRTSKLSLSAEKATFGLFWFKVEGGCFCPIRTVCAAAAAIILKRRFRRVVGSLVFREVRAVFASGACTKRDALIENLKEKGKGKGGVVVCFCLSRYK
jgi:hypothetical protein